MSNIEVFLCYAHQDEIALQEMVKHLGVLKRQGFFKIWYDREISAGSEWAQEIDQHLNTAQIILLFVSPNFLNSDYCYDIQMKHAIERHERKEARVIPIIVSNVYWGRTPFAKLEPLPKGGRPIMGSGWHSLEEAFFEVAEGIRRVAEMLLVSTNPSNDGVKEE